MEVTPKNTLARLAGCTPRCSCTSARRTNSSQRRRKLRSKRRSQKSRTRPFTAIRVSVTPSPGIVERTTMPRRRHSPMGEQANFCINNCGEPAADRAAPRRVSSNAAAAAGGKKERDAAGHVGLDLCSQIFELLAEQSAHDNRPDNHIGKKSRCRCQSPRRERRQAAEWVGLGGFGQELAHNLLAASARREMD